VGGGEAAKEWEGAPFEKLTSTTVGLEVVGMSIGSVTGIGGSQAGGDGEGTAGSGALPTTATGGRF
jgi:hypothetical protein